MADVAKRTISNTTDNSAYLNSNRDVELGHKYGVDHEGPIQPPRQARSQASLRSTFATVPSNTVTANPIEEDQEVSDANGQPGDEFAWGPAHPCFPHLNPHVPKTSEEYITTRVIRIRRDWMVAGDMAPTFSNLYPEILDPVVSEQEFRTIISKVNEAMVRAFDPYSWRNWIDATLGLLTGWFYEDLGLGGVKGHLRSTEAFLERWNRDVGAVEGVKVWPLRRTGYMTLDFQIPDPQVGVVGSDLGVGSQPPTRAGTEAPSSVA